MAKNSTRNHNNGNGPEHSAAGVVANPANLEEQYRPVTSPLAQLVTIKLEEDNYLLWKFQIENAILGYGLEDHVYGIDAAPPRMIQGNANLDFVRYQRQDRLLMSWILASISTSYLPQLVGCSSSQEIWTTIEQLFNISLLGQALQFSIHCQGDVLQTSNTNPQKRLSFYERLSNEDEELL